jgi:hypothetical protein
MQSAEFDAWLRNVTAKQDATLAHEEPAFYIADLQDRFEAVSGLFTRLNGQQPPKAIIAGTSTGQSEPEANATANATAGEYPPEQAADKGAAEDKITGQRESTGRAEGGEQGSEASQTAQTSEVDEDKHTEL